MRHVNTRLKCHGRSHKPDRHRPDWCRGAVSRGRAPASPRATATQTTISGWCGVLSCIGRSGHGHWMLVHSRCWVWTMESRIQVLRRWEERSQCRRLYAMARRTGGQEGMSGWGLSRHGGRRRRPAPILASRGSGGGTKVDGQTPSGCPRGWVAGSRDDAWWLVEGCLFCFSIPSLGLDGSPAGPDGGWIFCPDIGSPFGGRERWKRTLVLRE